MIESRKLEYYRDLVSVLVAKEFKIRYKSTVLGYAWSVMHPLVFAIIYFFVFSKLMRFETGSTPYFLYLVTGLFPWQWFATSLTASNTAFINNASLVKKVCFPRSFLPLAGNLNDLIHFVISIPVIIGFMAYYSLTGPYSFWPSASWLWQVPLLVLVQFFFTYGLSLIVATLNLFFRDLERFVTLFTTFWFFLNPIIYPLERIPERYDWITYANPMAAMTICWRAVLLEGSLPLGYCAAAAGAALIAFLLGQAIYRSLEGRFAELV